MSIKKMFSEKLFMRLNRKIEFIDMKYLRVGIFVKYLSNILGLQLSIRIPKEICLIDYIMNMCYAI